MVNVCAKYCGATILLKSFESVEQAKEFMKHTYVLYEADETENMEEECIYPDEMYLEDEIPFYESSGDMFGEKDADGFGLEPDELPF